MANKRQRLARKRFCQSTGVTHDPSHDAAKERKAHTNHKKRKAELHGKSGHSIRKKPKHEMSFDERTKSKKLHKHPLRVAGRRPGEACFICKAKDHVAKWCPRKQERDHKKVCLFCRQRGHTLRNCPNKQDVQEMNICYNCGKIGHRLTDCTDTIRDGGVPFAECFVCKRKGHLSKSCPSNTQGIYPKGGSCKVCSSIAHLAKDCPEKGSGKPIDNRSGRVKLQISKEVTSPSPLGGNSKRIVFGSGDDLEDDFDNTTNDQGRDEGSPTLEGSSHVSRKQSQLKDRKKKNDLAHMKPVVKRIGKVTPKIVNFID